MAKATTNSIREPQCVQALDMYGRLVTTEAKVENLEAMVIRTDDKLTKEISGLRDSLEAVKTQINNLQLRLAIIVALSAGIPSVAPKLITFIMGG